MRVRAAASLRVPAVGFQVRDFARLGRHAIRVGRHRERARRPDRGLTQEVLDVRTRREHPIRDDLRELARGGVAVVTRRSVRP